MYNVVWCVCFSGRKLQNVWSRMKRTRSRYRPVIQHYAPESNLFTEFNLTRLHWNKRSFMIFGLGFPFFVFNDCNASQWEVCWFLSFCLRKVNPHIQENVVGLLDILDLAFLDWLDLAWTNLSILIDCLAKCNGNARIKILISNFVGPKVWMIWWRDAILI